MPSITGDEERRGEQGEDERAKGVASASETGGSNAESSGNADATHAPEASVGESAKRKNNEVAATPDRPTRSGVSSKGRGSERSGGRETKKKKGGIMDLFDRMNKQKEEMKNNRSATKISEMTPHISKGNGEGGKVENPPILLKTPTPSLYPKGSMKPSQIKKAKTQSDKIKKANEKLAAATASKEGSKGDKGECNEGGKEPTGFVSFEGEQPTFKDYMYVEFKVQVDKQKGKKTKECFEETMAGGIEFL